MATAAAPILAAAEEDHIEKLAQMVDSFLAEALPVLLTKPDLSRSDLHPFRELADAFDESCIPQFHTRDHSVRSSLAEHADRIWTALAQINRARPALDPLLQDL